MKPTEQNKFNIQSQKVGFSGYGETRYGYILDKYSSLKKVNNDMPGTGTGAALITACSQYIPVDYYIIYVESNKSILHVECSRIVEFLID